MVHVLIIDTDKNIVSVGSGYKGTPEEVFLKVAMIWIKWQMLKI